MAQIDEPMREAFKAAMIEAASKQAIERAEAELAHFETWRDRPFTIDDIEALTVEWYNKHAS